MYHLPRLLVLTTAALAVSTAALAGESALRIDDPYVRLVPSGTTTTGAFMTIHNASSAERKLVKATSPISDKVQLHTHMNENGVMKMREVPRIEIKAHGQTELKPGSFHVMLIDLKEPLQEGGTVPITLEFDDGSTYRVLAPIRKPQVGMPEHKSPHSGMPGH